MNKKFDCVEMKHRAAQKIRTRIASFSAKEELAFWREQTESLKKQQRKLARTEKAKP